MGFARGCLRLFVLACLCACSQMQIVENTASAVSIHYYSPVQSLEDATDAARKACAAYAKSAHLRTTELVGVAEHFAHFDCVSS